ncbi:AraC family transcriptional regulator [Nocardia sp. 348MFTsu5.1]|uniref:AraC family transcriptional regulator n=1 Tax=Nocardia sp. 348MFTsu5.1 TaxID=1172185 RepID=UPI0003781A38|nr:AraC family transcriptional regulator [Nocardia sp. 348MFTsu5.1]
MKPLVRYAALANYVELTRTLGADPGALLRSTGLDPGGVRSQDRWVPAESVVELLERTASQTGRPDLGLRLAELRRLSHLGPLSLVLREEPDVRSALQVLIRHESMYNEVLHTRVTTADGIASVRIDFDLGTRQTHRQSVDLAVGVLFGLLRGFLGPDWRPLAVCFGHPEPADTTTARRMFPAVVRYDHEFDGVVLYESDLDRPNAMSDPQLRTYVQRVLPPDGSGDKQPRTAARVRELIEMLLPTGRCSIEQIARSMGVDRRTVHRRLASEGATFTAVLDDARADLARHLVEGRRHSFTEVAELLGFASPSNFSRWFRDRFDATPRQWRARSPR